MSNLARCFTNPDAVEAQLAAIGPGLTIELLHNCLKAGHSARENTSQFHPRLHGPFNGYAEGTAMLRMQLWAHGWTLDDGGNYARIVSPDGKHCIVVSSGDENTGIDGGTDPLSRSPKGAMTEAAVTLNAQLTFLGGLGMAPTPADRGDLGPRTWVLLVNETEETIRAELSTPTHFEGGRPEMRATRLLLPPYDLGDGSDPRRRGPDSGDDFDVDVVRRQG